MHRVKGASINLREVLAKVRGEILPPPEPVTYSSSDIAAAKNVLANLLNRASQSEVTYTRITPIVVES